MTMTIENIAVRVRFFEPFRVIPHQKKEHRTKDSNYLRGGTWARWHFRSKTEGRPYIPGTLLRSVLVREIEHMLTLYNPYKCCRQGFRTTERDLARPDYLRRTDGFQFEGESPGCNADDPCPLCLLLGRFDAQREKKRGVKKLSSENKNAFEKNLWSVHFGNMSLRDEQALLWQENVQERIANRVDTLSGKAKDYYRIHEIDHRTCPEFFGTITLNCPEKADKIKRLLAAGLAKVTLLAGALCRLDILNAEDDGCSTSKHDELIHGFMTDAGEPVQGFEAPDIPAVEELKRPCPADRAGIKELAKGIATIEALEKGQKLRQLADAIRAVRGFTRQELEELPEGKTPENKTLWAKKISSKNNKTLKDIFLDLQSTDRGEWADFCDALAEELYQIHKNNVSEPPAVPRLLGETEYYGKPADRNVDPEYVPRSARQSFGCVVIITGTLCAETPFCFGSEASDTLSGHPIVLSADGSYRLPRTVLRGVLRRDLRELLAAGCAVELGRARPCSCPVCEVMRTIIIADSVSSYCEPPEVRQRIRLNPHRGTVEEGALFDFEAGPQGILIPFSLRVMTKSDRIPHALWMVLDRWQQGLLQLGGDAGIGMGRFTLADIACQQYNLAEPECFTRYLLARGAVCRNKEIETLQVSFDGLCNEITGTHFRPHPWQKLSFFINVNSPLISNDPVAAMLHPDNRDAVMVKKTILEPDGNGGCCKKSACFLRGSSLRGALRFAAGRNREHTDGDFLHDLDHHECDCELCRLFGNEHGQGLLRVEDGEIKDAGEMRCDHVAIDRFHGGSVEHKKFDDWPLEANPSRPLAIDCTLWVKSDIKDPEKALLKYALEQLRNGRIPLGGSTGTGYGCVGEVKFTEKPDWLDLDDAPATSIAEQELPPSVAGPAPSIELKNKNVYYPHCFIKSPGTEVKRELDIISHARSVHGNENKKDKLLSGKITCSLTTKGPVFIPDTKSHKEKEKENEHTVYTDFFNVAGNYAIPGSELRGMISSVYETLTNSCYRIMEEGRYLTRRNPPKGQKNEVLSPGRVERDENGSLCIRLCGIPNEDNQDQVKPVRLPLYDDWDVTSKITFEGSSKRPDKHTYKGKTKPPTDEHIKAALANNVKIAETARTNRRLLLSRPENERLEILDGCRQIWFQQFPLSQDNPNDILAEFVLDEKKCDPGVKSGYVKFTGVNFANSRNCNTHKGDPWNDDWDARKLNMLLISGWAWRASLKKRYPRPRLVTSIDNKQYTVPKRCERIFTDLQDRTFSVTTEVRCKYNQVLRDYRDNYGRIAQQFLTYVPHRELTEGDLVYFSHDGSAVKRIVPVPISRLVDKDPLIKRLPDDSLRPCTIEPSTCAEECEECPERCKKVADYFSPHPKGLCPACHLFGTPYYKGRVNFGFAWLQGNNPTWYVHKEDNHQLTLKLLERPRPTWSMPNDNSPVPGRKFYVHHPHSVAGLKGNKDKNKNNTTVTPFAPDNVFTFDVQFSNLRSWELGLLLYSLELEEGLGHKLGMGKPLGLGSVIVRINDIAFFDGNISSNNEFCKKNYIESGLQKLHGWFNNQKSWDTIPHIAALRSILKMPEENGIRVEYPQLETTGKEKGYIDLKKELRDTDRMAILQTPWRPWWPMPGTGQGNKKQKKNNKSNKNLTASIDSMSKQSGSSKKELQPQNSDNRHTGTVKWFNQKKGYGFIEQEGTQDVFVHITGVQLQWQTALKDRQQVRYSVRPGKKGPEAFDVEIIDT